MDVVLLLALAFALDLTFGDPPNRLHPVAWLGHLIGLQLKLAPRHGSGRQLIYGGLVLAVTTAAAAALCFFLFTFLRAHHPAAFVVVGGITLKLTFSLRGLVAAARRVGRHIAAGSVSDARHNLRSLVSRDTSHLAPDEVLAAAVSSVAENGCDSFTAPVFYFLLFGLPGAIAYRVVNTYDAMVGYHGDYEYLGKAAARLDDLLNLLPARLTALTLVAAAWLCRQRARHAWRAMWLDHRRTPSPNAGWTMSAIAGALGIKLEKRGVYRVGGTGIAQADDVDLALRLVGASSLVWGLCAILITGVVYAVP